MERTYSMNLKIEERYFSGISPLLRSEMQCDTCRKSLFFMAISTKLEGSFEENSLIPVLHLQISSKSIFSSS